jgi:hypothetical protein
MVISIETDNNTDKNFFFNSFPPVSSLIAVCNCLPPQRPSPFPRLCNITYIKPYIELFFNKKPKRKISKKYPASI